jgi:DNA-binding response OmpR family regulator
MRPYTTPPSILLADPDAKSREAFGAFFQRSGWRYDIVTDGDSVVGALNKTEYDIIIADVAMPNADGLALLSNILRERPGQAIIAVSADTSYDQALRFFRSGATDLLSRPVDFSWLERVVRQVVSDRRADERERQLYRFVTSERTELRFTCRQLAEIDTVSLPIIDRLLSSKLLDQGSALRLKLAVQEALVNGLEHGNLELSSEWKEEVQADGGDRFSLMRKERLLDPDFANRTVTVQSWFDGARLEITIEDEGKGFLNSVEFITNRAKSNRVACSGRGLALMSSAVDEVTFSNNGSEVTLLKYLSRNGG